MDHAYIEDNQIAERYVRGTLPAAERERFEQHYLSCPECLDRLDLAQAVRQGFRRMAEEDAAQLAAVRQLAVVAWLARLGRQRQIGVLLAALLVLTVLPAGLGLRGIRGRERELAEARSAAGRESAAEVVRLGAALDESRRERDRERAARLQATEQLAQAFEPRPNVPILSLDAERDAGPESGEPAQRVRSPGATGWIALVLAINSPSPRSYRAVLRDRGGRELRRVEDLRLIAPETLSLTLPARLVPPGDYSLTVESETAGGRPTVAGRFRFRVLPPV